MEEMAAVFPTQGPFCHIVPVAREILSALDNFANAVFAFASAEGHAPVGVDETVVVVEEEDVDVFVVVVLEELVLVVVVVVVVVVVEEVFVVVEEVFVVVVEGAAKH
jgi:hypothetical protein